MYKVRIMDYNNYGSKTDVYYNLMFVTFDNEIVYDMSELDFSRFIIKAISLYDIAIEMDGQQQVTIRLKSKIQPFRSDGSF